MPKATVAACDQHSGAGAKFQRAAGTPGEQPANEEEQESQNRDSADHRNEWSDVHADEDSTNESEAAGYTIYTFSQHWSSFLICSGLHVTLTLRLHLPTR